ncbi:cAMP phosphodiesterases class-II-domain-containing protein [Neohortaea acidophila]|uniref:cAMP phosphodiesterases class-II-domain-containing protein n=1 Tax=Neohortaea acidophila TaxID=245834 RepID=A0A6A6PZU1_9PEZI|nr:cAMP phosphodiesterases class-II-domain-containing protein [Neohortaea acidophila]KAF2485728.1 cAMP phosphodiesterases class-II-domain-containing protein [Neohortaea acidophila]
MPDDKDEPTESDIGLHEHKPALQVICLGSGGGPSEENVTGLLVRSVASDWAKGSLLAVDAGSHLAPIVKILERDFPNEIVKPEPTVLTAGPFAGLTFPNTSARANALHVLRNYISTYLITHPHLDHLSGFAINTAAFHATSRPKTVAALPSTVDAIKQHIFNDVIWPNLTDEDGGVGFVTFQRLKEGGDLMIGEGEGRGYIEVSDGLGVKPFKVSHGVCTKSPPSHRHRGSVPNIYDSQPPYNGSGHGEPAANPARQTSLTGGTGQYSTPGTPARQTFYNSTISSPHMSGLDHKPCVVDSTAYFVRDSASNREVLIFGDVEPDSISMSPRTHYVWQEAARKIAHGLLTGIFIECSYDDSQADAVLFGHLNPRHLIEELQTLAALVVDAKAARHFERAVKKRKRSGPNGLEGTKMAGDRKRSRSLAGRSGLSREPRRSTIRTSPSTAPPAHSSEPPLHGVKVVVIHIKDTMKDGPHVRDSILAQLEQYEQLLQAEGRGLGCEFEISADGASYWF